MEPPSVAAWLTRITSEAGPEKPLTRLVLLVLARYMVEDVCDLTLEKLVEYTGMSDTGVRKSLIRAETDGWLTRERARMNTKGWRRNVYRPQIPTFHVKRPVAPGNGGEGVRV